jgi:hypothetical protein
MLFLSHKTIFIKEIKMVEVVKGSTLNVNGVDRV